MGWGTLIKALPTIIKTAKGAVDNVGEILSDETDHEKREEARDEIKTEAKHKGLELSDHIVNLLIELSVLVQKYDVDIKVVEDRIVLTPSKP